MKPPAARLVFGALLLVILASATVQLRAEPAASGVAGSSRHFLSRDDGSSDVTSVASTVFNGYSRPVGPDGKVRPETYAFAEGHGESTGPADKSVDRMPFLRVAQTIAGPLAQQNYLASTSGKDTDLLIFVFWGTTGPETNASNNTRTSIEVAPPLTAQGMVSHEPDPMGTATHTNIKPTGPTGGFDSAFDSVTATSNRERDQQDERTAQILGYDRELANASYRRRAAVGHGTYDDLISDIEDPRYYVVLAAYDFREFLNHKRQKLLWTTRFSIRTHGNDFERDLESMTRQAAKYFGRDSNGLHRNLPLRGRVDLGELKIIGTEPAKSDK